MNKRARRHSRLGRLPKHSPLPRPWTRTSPWRFHHTHHTSVVAIAMLLVGDIAAALAAHTLGDHDAIAVLVFGALVAVLASAATLTDLGTNEQASSMSAETSGALNTTVCGGHPDFGPYTATDCACRFSEPEWANAVQPQQSGRSPYWL